MSNIITNKDDFNNVSSALNKIDYSLALIHSDIFYGFKFDGKLSRQELLDAHWNCIKELVDERPVWMPAFNYDFTKTKQFDVLNSKSQVGVLPEFFRTKIARWRSVVPLFSFSGNRDEPDTPNKETIDPFDSSSLFDILTNNNGLIIYYGTELNCSTILHYCERISEVLYYRYDKLFKGEILYKDDTAKNVTLNYHVRPKGYTMEYDWELFKQELVDNNLLLTFDSDNFHIKIIKALPLVDYWITKMKGNCLSLLDKKTREWVAPKLEELGRPFQLSDFE